MCLIVIALALRDDYPLMIAANRDEYFARASAPADFWPDLPQVLGGRDVEQGGTWLGVAPGGRFAAVTNFRDGGRRAGRKSRGWLVRDFLAGDASPEAYLAGVEAERERYDGFNLIVGIGTRLAHYSNRSHQITPLTAGVYGLSNHLLDTPWPKVERAKQAMRGLKDVPADAVEAGLTRLLADDARAADEDLPSTGVPLEWERVLSSAFIRTDGYGTRASTLVLRAVDGTTVLSEAGYGPEGQALGTRRFVLQA